MRLCLGHPKVHFGTIVEGSWGGGGGGVLGGSSGLLHYKYDVAADHMLSKFCFFKENKLADSRACLLEDCIYEIG